MAKVPYPPLLEKISQNVKVIWRGHLVDRGEDPWEELAKHAIKFGQPVDVEEMLDKKGFEDVEDHL